MFRRSVLVCRLAFCSTLALSLSFAWESTAYSQRSGKGPAYTTPPEDDPNFALMGEFAGRIRVVDQETGEQTRRQLTLQIRPLSGDQFQAMAYYGGLPGQQQHEPEAMRLIGLRSENSLVLSGGPWAIFVDPEGCTLVGPKGGRVGRLNRVQRTSPTLGATPPEGAIVLFDGTGLDHFVGAEMTEDGLLKQGALIAPMFQDFDLHIEFRLPYMPLADGQQRGNSGLYLQSRYECQVLDSFGTERMYNGLGALYRQKAPDINMALPPLVWQTYDVRFTAPRWASDGTKVRNAHITSWVNGVVVQDNVSLPTKTGAGKPEEPTLRPINIQDHGDPVRFRNLWIIDRGITDAPFPVLATKEQREAAAKLEWNEPPVSKADSGEETKSEDGDAEASEAEEDEDASTPS